MTAYGLIPDPWQHQALHSTAARQLWLCCRQSGKSQTAACLALGTAFAEPGSLILLLSPSLRQSAELFRNVLTLVHGRTETPAAESLLRLELHNGSRIVSLPGTEGTVRGYAGVRLLVIDEAARVLDELYYSVRPMLAVSGGRLIALSTPFGKRGWFYREYTEGQGWERTKITALECPRISPTFLEEERRSLPRLWFDSEYMCAFADTVDQVFRSEDIDVAFVSTIQPLSARR